MIFDIETVEEKIGYKFKDKILLRQCFTHASYANENGCEDNELLEFFGDAILEFVVTEYLVKNCYGDEGVLTKKRASIVSKDPLLYVVKKMRLGEHILMSAGQGDSTNKTEKLYSSLYEALVAGIYKDGGMTAVKKFIESSLIQRYKKGEFGSEDKQKKSAESKNELQMFVQKEKIGSIAYEVLSKKGPDNSPTFRVAVTLNGRKIAEGEGSSKKSAESEGARKALINLKGGKEK